MNYQISNTDEKQFSDILTPENLHSTTSNQDPVFLIDSGECES